MKAAAAICSLPKVRLIVCGRNERRLQSKNPITAKLMKKPAIGDVIMGISTLLRMPSNITTFQVPAEATAAPQSPPIKAWLELEGNPSHQVSKFQTIPPSRPHRIVVNVTKWLSTRSLPIVVATAVPDKAPRSSKI